MNRSILLSALVSVSVSIGMTGIVWAQNVAPSPNNIGAGSSKSVADKVILKKKKLNGKKAPVKAKATAAAHPARPLKKVVKKQAIKVPAQKAAAAPVVTSGNPGQTVPQSQYQSQYNSFNAPIMSPVPTVSTKVSTSEGSEKKSDWGLKYRSNNAMMLNAMENPVAPQNNASMDHELAAWDRVNIDYHINSNLTVDLLGQFYHTWFGDRDRLQNPSIPELQQPYAGYVGETGLGLVDSKLAELVGGLTLDGYVGYFFPTAEWEQEAGTLGAVRANLGLGRSFGQLDVKWIESVWWYFERYQTSSVYDTGVNWNPATGGAQDPTQFFRAPMPGQNVIYNVWSLSDFTWNFSKKFFFDLTAGFMNAATYADTNALTARPGVLNDYIILDPEVGYAFSKHFTLEVGLWEEADMRNQTVAYYPFNGETTNTQFYFQTTIAF